MKANYAAANLASTGNASSSTSSSTTSLQTTRDSHSSSLKVSATNDVHMRGETRRGPTNAAGVGSSSTTRSKWVDPYDERRTSSRPAWDQPKPPRMPSPPPLKVTPDGKTSSTVPSNVGPGSRSLASASTTPTTTTTTATNTTSTGLKRPLSPQTRKKVADVIAYCLAKRDAQKDAPTVAAAKSEPEPVTAASLAPLLGLDSEGAYVGRHSHSALDAHHREEEEARSKRRRLGSLPPGAVGLGSTASSSVQADPSGGVLGYGHPAWNQSKAGRSSVVNEHAGGATVPALVPSDAGRSSQASSSALSERSPSLSRTKTYEVARQPVDPSTTVPIPTHSTSSTWQDTDPRPAKRAKTTSSDHVTHLHPSSFRRQSAVGVSDQSQPGLSRKGKTSVDKRTNEELLSVLGTISAGVGRVAADMDRVAANVDRIVAGFRSLPSTATTVSPTTGKRWRPWESVQDLPAGNASSTSPAPFSATTGTSSFTPEAPNSSSRSSTASSTSILSDASQSARGYKATPREGQSRVSSTIPAGRSFAVASLHSGESTPTDSEECARLTNGVDKGKGREVGQDASVRYGQVLQQMPGTYEINNINGVGAQGSIFAAQTRQATPVVTSTNPYLSLSVITGSGRRPQLGHAHSRPKAAVPPPSVPPSKQRPSQRKPSQSQRKPVVASTSLSPPPPTTLAKVPRVYLQDACLLHKFVRSRDKSNVFERPERLRAINVGIAAAYARLEFAAVYRATSEKGDSASASTSTARKVATKPFDVVRSMASVDICSHGPARVVHGDPYDCENCYAVMLKSWCAKVKDQINECGSEIPEGYEQDLYLCPESMTAFEGALGTVCEAVDGIMAARPVQTPESQPLPAKPSSSSAGRASSASGLDSRAFVVVRPPGHHCSKECPMGFGFVNNVMVGAMHAILKHRVRRVVIFDYDLHHGNGTQEIVRSVPKGPEEPSFFYGSIHDLNSYPCEAGEHELQRDATMVRLGVNGDWLHNIPLKPYSTESQFWKHYEETYSELFVSAQKFLDATSRSLLATEGSGVADDDDVLIFISSGFDASEYETEEMSRHGHHVPTSFYHRFTRDVCKFAARNSRDGGRIVSVLEGGYSDRALISGALSHVTALADEGGVTDQGWWDPKALDELEKATKKRRGRPTRVEALDGWVRRAVEIFSLLDSPSLPPSSHPPSHSSNSPDPGSHLHSSSTSPPTASPTPHPPSLQVPIPPLADPLLSSMIASEVARERKSARSHSHFNTTSNAHSRGSANGHGNAKANGNGSGREAGGRTTRAAARKLEKGIVGGVDWRRENLESPG